MTLRIKAEVCVSLTSSPIVPLVYTTYCLTLHRVINSTRRARDAAIDQAPMLEVRNLTKRYKLIPVVDNVSFSIRPGDILGFLGPNGAGKSTTVKILIGLIEPTRGEILFRGTDVRANWPAFLRVLGYVPEEPSLYPQLTG